MRERILFCTHSIDNGGAAKSLSILIKYLGGNFSPAILSLREPTETSSYMEFYQELKVPVFVFPFGWLPTCYINCPINVEAQKKRMDEMRPWLPQLRWLGAPADYICFNGYPSTSIAPYFDKGTPRVMIAREMLCKDSGSMKIDKFLRANIAKGIAIGPLESAQLSEIGIANEIVFNSYEDIPEPAPWPDAPPITFGVFARFGPDKGLDTLCGAIRGESEALRSSRAIVKIYGAYGVQDFGLEKLLVSFIDKFRLHDLIILEPWTHDIRTAMTQIHCLIRPDKSGSPWGRDIIEAMSLGRPVVATGTLDVFVRSGENGWLVPPGDSSGLGKVLAQIAANPERLRLAGHHAFQFAKDNFNPAINSRKIADYLFNNPKNA